MLALLIKATGLANRVRQAGSSFVFPEQVSSPSLGAAQAPQVWYTQAPGLKLWLVKSNLGPNAGLSVELRHFLSVFRACSDMLRVV